jgi:hypothetical protein
MSAPVRRNLFKTRTVSCHPNERGKTLNQIISTVKSEYVLFLQHSDYLAPAIHLHSLQMPPQQAVISHLYQHQQMKVSIPFLVRTSTLQKYPFSPDEQLPFKEALFPVWLSHLDASIIVLKENLVKQRRIVSNRDTLEKLKLLQKYQKPQTVQQPAPSLSIFISNYNMEDYVETAIASCHFQSVAADQIAIIDDGSTDRSLDRIKTWADEAKIQLFTKHNEGKAKALNDLLPHITSTFVLELDADDWLDADAVAVIKQRLRNLPSEAAVLYGNLRKWKEMNGDVRFKTTAKDRSIKSKAELLNYRFPLGPRIYRTSALRDAGGFPVISFQEGRLYEDVSVLLRLQGQYQLQYDDFTVYNVREHAASITRKNRHWEDFRKHL